MMELFIIIVAQLGLVLSAFAVLPKEQMVKADWLLLLAALLPVAGAVVLILRTIIILLTEYGDRLEALFSTPFTKVNPWKKFDKKYKYIYQFTYGSVDCLVITTHSCVSLDDFQNQSFNNFDFLHRTLPKGHYDLTYLTREEYDKRA